MTSSPISTASIHTEHSALPSCPIMFLSAGFFGSAAMAAAEAGPGALLVFVCSIICVIIRSRASSEKTASPWAPLPSIWASMAGKLAMLAGWPRCSAMLACIVCSNVASTLHRVLVRVLQGRTERDLFTLRRSGLAGC